MTSFYDALDPTNFPLIRYVDLPKNAVPVRRPGRFAVARRITFGAIVAAALLVAAVSFVLGGRPAAGAAVDNEAIPGEFRLGPGNQQPPGIVNPVVGAPVEPGWVPSIPPAPFVGAPVEPGWVPSLPPAPFEATVEAAAWISSVSPASLRLAPVHLQPSSGVVNPPD